MPDALVVEVPTPTPRFRVLARLDENGSIRRAAFRASPVCLSCGKELHNPDDGRVVPTKQGVRLACAMDCFTKALVEHAEEIRLACAGGSKFARGVVDDSDPLTPFRRRLVETMKRLDVDRDNPRHIEARIRSIPAYATLEALNHIKQLELTRVVYNAWEIVASSSPLALDDLANQFGIPEFAYVAIFEALGLL